ACGDDQALRARVEALLRVHEEERSFLATPPEEVAFLASAPGSMAEGPGTQIGPYKLVEQLGEGGFGIVYKAEQQQPVRRTVALKVLKPGLETRQIVARFEAERQALALMDHPHIARVLDGGATASGRPYFVMELVQGEPITRFCDSHLLTPRERLALFLSVCHAIQHAHQKGLIHRDVKPTNVLVATYDGKPVPKVIDFGVAKALGQPLTERTLVTGFGSVIGTLEYMSPEQAECNATDIDTRSDIYSLGVLLYELLTGTTPISSDRFHQVALTEVLRAIREEEPPKPSTRLSESKERLASISAQRRREPARLSREIRGELDWIVMKALEKDRNRRYNTSAALAEDIDRYLRQEAIFARPPSAAYRLKKFVQRHRAAALGLVAVALALLVGSTVAAWQAIVATEAKKDALTAAAAEAQARQQADAKELETRTVLDFVERRIMAAARPEGQAGGLGRDVTLRLALEAALPVVDTSFIDQPLLEARLRLTLGDSFRYLGEPQIASKQYQRARTLYTHHLGLADPRTLESMYHLADSYAELGHYTQALQLRQETLARREAVLGPYHRETLRSMHSVASSYADHHRDAEALELDKKTVALQTKYLGPDDSDTLESMNSLALSYSAMEKYSEELDLLKEVAARRTRKYGPSHPDTLLSLNNLANGYLDVKQYEKALKLRRQLLELQKTKLGPTHPHTLTTMYNMANTYGFLKRYKEALEFHRAALAGRRLRFGPDHRLTLYSMWGVAFNLFRLGQGDEGVRLTDEVVERCLRLKEVQPELYNLMNSRMVYFEQHRDAAGCRTTAELFEKLHRTDPKSLYNMGCYRAVIAKTIRATDKSAVAAKQADAEADRAMAWLRKAVAAGYHKVQMLKTDADLDALRGRADFQKLVAELESHQPR
ncbi:MAG TPA: serine/threonine-protein kinase, partial [Gemmataceae bacterium]|nr:serine/threonine-protein kinase [Gemmataceae bacterium]